MSNDPFNTENFKAQFQKKVEFGEGNGVGGDYTYIAKLLLSPVTDGRHRLLWLVLAPYAVSILKRDRESAIELITKYLEECDGLKPCPDVLIKVEQYVDYAANIELRPPREETLKKNDPDLWAIIERVIT